jgi:hypothetical protein
LLHNLSARHQLLHKAASGYFFGQYKTPEMDMPKLKIIAAERCCRPLADEARIGWEAAAYLTLEAMQDGRHRARRPAASALCRR